MSNPANPEGKGQVVPFQELTTKRLVRDELRSKREERAPLDTVTANVAALDASISFILNAIFGGKPNKAELRIVRAMFSPTANIVLIPRGRPTLACALSVDEFFAREDEVLKYEDNWRETMRSQDPFADSSRQTCIKVAIVLDALDAEAVGNGARHVDLIFTLRGTSPSQRIASCTIVFDETYSGRSPATLY